MLDSGAVLVDVLRGMVPSFWQPSFIDVDVDSVFRTFFNLFFWTVEIGFVYHFEFLFRFTVIELTLLVLWVWMLINKYYAESHRIVMHKKTYIYIIS